MTQILGGMGLSDGGGDPLPANLITGSLTSPRIPYATGLNTLGDNANFRWDNPNGRLVITLGGTTVDAPTSPITPVIHLSGDNASPALLMDAAGQVPALVMRRASGTIASKTPVAASGAIFAFRAEGYTGALNGYLPGGLLRLNVNSGGDLSDTNAALDFVVLLTAFGTITAPAERFRVTGRSNVLLGAAGEPSTGTIGMFFGDGTVPATLASNTAGLYGNDVSGTVNLFTINEAGDVNQLSGDIKIASGKYFYCNTAAFMLRTTTAWSNGAAAQTGTLTNAPAAGNPTKWIPVDDNGTTRYIPAW